MKWENGTEMLQTIQRLLSFPSTDRETALRLLGDVTDALRTGLPELPTLHILDTSTPEDTRQAEFYEMLTNPIRHRIRFNDV